MLGTGHKAGARKVIAILKPGLCSSYMCVSQNVLDYLIPSLSSSSFFFFVSSLFLILLKLEKYSSNSDFSFVIPGSGT